MAEKGLWDRLREELDSPWDWIAAGAGATGGLLVSASTLGTDVGASVGVGALGLVTARKTGVVALKGRRLRRRTGAVRSLIAQELGPDAELLKRIERDFELWKLSIIAVDQYETLLDEYVAQYRRLTDALPRQPRSSSPRNLQL